LWEEKTHPPRSHQSVLRCTVTTKGYEPRSTNVVHSKLKYSRVEQVMQSASLGAPRTFGMAGSDSELRTETGQ